MWNDTDIPLAYLITFRTYGSWLHGDERGSVSRHRNVFGTRRLPHEERWREVNTGRMNGEAILLNAKARVCVKAAIKETCKIRGWSLFAINVRTNHTHAVVAAGGAKAGAVLNALKANSTRMMREKRCWFSNKSPWADKGSNRYLWNEESIAGACRYVEFGQGDDLPEFD